MFSNQKSKKIDISFLKYLSEDDLATPCVTMDQINKSYPHTKKSTLEALKLFYVLNFNWLDEEQRTEIKNKIDMLLQREEKQFKFAINTIECQKAQELIQD
jgi:hypothetical protein